jgi:flagellar biosynthesis GTPase FlhF
LHDRPFYSGLWNASKSTLVLTAGKSEESVGYVYSQVSVKNNILTGFDESASLLKKHQAIEWQRIN